MNFKGIIIIIGFIISACNQNYTEKKGSENPTITESSSINKEEADTTTYDPVSKIIIKMSLKDSSEVINDKKYYETDTNERTVIELKGSSKIKYHIDSYHPKITINYKQKVNGYKVQVITGLDSSFVQRDTSIIEFSDKKGNKKYFLVYHFMDRTFDEIIYNLGKARFCRDSSFYLDYKQIEKDRFLGYDMPFYFQDVNLDGETELVFNGYLQYCRDNHSLYVYSLSQNKFITTPPFDRMSSDAKYDVKKSTITWFSSSGAFYWGKYTYKFYRSSDNDSNINFYLNELVVCSGWILSTYQYNRKGEVTNTIHEHVNY